MMMMVMIVMMWEVEGSKTDEWGLLPAPGGDVGTRHHIIIGNKNPIPVKIQYRSIVSNNGRQAQIQINTTVTTTTSDQLADWLLLQRADGCCRVVQPAETLVMTHACCSKKLKRPVLPNPPNTEEPSEHSLMKKLHTHKRKLAALHYSSRCMHHFFFCN